MSKLDDPRIGPHEGRELELLLAGVKPLARLHSEPATGFTEDLTPFEPHVKAGTLLHKDVPSEDGLYIAHYFYLPGEEWRIKILELAMTTFKQPGRSSLTSEDLHRLDGTLLGYTKEEVDFFIKNLNN
jgi:hypothetical protein